MHVRINDQNNKIVAEIKIIYYHKRAANKHVQFHKQKPIIRHK